MIQIVKVSKKYDKKNIFINFNYIFKDTGFYVIKGKNGSGKTTLLNIISGLTKYESGKIYYNGYELNEKSFCKIRKKELGYIFQNINLNKNLNVEENLKIGYFTCNDSLKDFYRKEKEVLKRLRIGNLIHQKICNLSGGEKTRIAIARSLIRDASVILCDEPTSSLDSKNANIIYDTLKELSKDHLIVLVSHDATFLSQIENDKFYNIIDLDNQKYEKNYDVVKTTYKIKNYSSKHFLIRCFYFFKNYIKTSLLFLLLLSTIIVFLSVFIQFSNDYDYDYYYNYITENNIDVSFLSESNTELSKTPVNGSYVGFDKYYLNTTFNYTPEFRTLEDSNESFDIMSSENIETVFEEGFFNNIIIDNSLDENEIDLTSILYDYANAYGKVSGSNMCLGSVTLTVNDIIDRDYSNVNDDTLSNDIDYFNLEYYQKCIYMSYTTYGNILAFIPDDYFKSSIDNSSSQFSFYNTTYLNISNLQIYDNYSLSDLTDGNIMIWSIYDYTGQVIDLEIGSNVYSYNVLCGINISNTIIMTYNDYCDFYENQFELDIEDESYGVTTDSTNLESLFNYATKYDYYLYFVNSNIFYSNYESLLTQLQFLFQFFYLIFFVYTISLFLIIFFYKKSNNKNIALLMSIGYSKNDIRMQGILSNLFFIILSLPISVLISKYFYSLISIKIDAKLSSNMSLDYNYNYFFLIFSICLVSIELFTYIFTTKFKKDIYTYLNL